MGVSVDSSREQIAFAAELGLTLSLVPDIDRNLCLLYGAAKQIDDLAARMSVLIDKQGVIRWIDRDVQVTTHGADVLSKLHELGMTK
jgi:peroxiredoxin Q/BCP